MAKPPYLEEDSIKNHTPKDHTHKTKGLCFFVSISFLFIYISIFYIFNLSPYTLFNNHIFWFFMSNTLILIIAADYGAFSASKHKQHLFEEYGEHSLTRNYVSSSYVPKYEQVDKKCMNPILKKVLGGELMQENKETITHNSEIPEERVLEIVAQNDPKKPSKWSKSNIEKKPVLPLQVDDSYFKACGETAVPARIYYQRSKSDRPNRAKRVENIDERMKRVKRSETMKAEAKVEEENDFSTMTNEELNKRVEEFIQNFNRQIRLQATRNVYQI